MDKAVEYYACTVAEEWWSGANCSNIDCLSHVVMLLQRIPDKRIRESAMMSSQVRNDFAGQGIYRSTVFIVFFQGSLLVSQ